LEVTKIIAHRRDAGPAEVFYKKILSQRALRLCGEPYEKWKNSLTLALWITLASCLFEPDKYACIAADMLMIPLLYIYINGWFATA
jgi:hypothetical protein